MKRFLILGIFINILTTFGFGQIQVGGDNPAEKQEKTKEKNISSTTKKSDVNVFIGGTFGHSYRKLTPNTNDLFADSLGVRKNETGINTQSWHLGFSSEISNFLMWEGGISFLKNGEQYEYAVSDSIHRYTTNHKWVGVPLKLYAKYDVNKFRFQLGGGLIPHMQTKYVRKDFFKDKNKVESNSEIKSLVGMNNFGVSVIGNLGVHYSLMPNLGVYVLFEYRQQLTSSYLNTNPYIHKANVIGANVGITFGI